MVSQVIVKTFCNVCLKEWDRQVDAEPYPQVSIGRLVRDLDLCADCRKVADAFREWLEKYGEKPEATTEPKAAPSPKGGRLGAIESGVHPQTCLECGSTHKNRGALRTHVRVQHGIGINELERRAEEDGRIPRDPKRRNGRHGSSPCEHCEFVADGAQGLAAHYRTKHPEIERRYVSRRQKAEVA